MEIKVDIVSQMQKMEDSTELSEYIEKRIVG